MQIETAAHHGFEVRQRIGGNVREIVVFNNGDTHTTYNPKNDAKKFPDAKVIKDTNGGYLLRLQPQTSIFKKLFPSISDLFDWGSISLDPNSLKATGILPNKDSNVVVNIGTSNPLLTKIHGFGSINIEVFNGESPKPSINRNFRKFAQDFLLR